MMANNILYCMALLRFTSVGLPGIRGIEISIKSDVEAPDTRSVLGAYTLAFMFSMGKRLG